MKLKSMIDPKKRLRQTLFSFHKISYRIKKKELSREDMNKKLFVEVMNQLKQIEDRRDFMQEEIGLDMTLYEDSFFSVIENLLKMTFNKEQLALIQMYLYQLVPDKDWDGTITIELTEKKKVTEQTVEFKTPSDVWDVISKYTK